jgi:hypothetical protein
MFNKIFYLVMIVISALSSIAIAVAGIGIAQGWALTGMSALFGKKVEDKWSDKWGIAKEPVRADFEYALKKLIVVSVIGLAMLESLAIYSLVISLILLFKTKV